MVGEDINEFSKNSPMSGFHNIHNNFSAFPAKMEIHYNYNTTI